MSVCSAIRAKMRRPVGRVVTGVVLLLICAAPAVLIFARWDRGFAIRLRFTACNMMTSSSPGGR